MKKNVAQWFLVAISVFVTVSVFSYCCFAVKMNNSKCEYNVQMFTCETAASYFCSISQGKYPGDCISCQSSASLPLTACAPLEGSTCELDGRAGTNCTNVSRQRAPCVGVVHPGGTDYSCGTFVVDGSCDSQSNFLPCY
jgi:hypothetical protein